MHYSKPVLTAMAVLLILSLTFTTAGAQSGAPEGMVDAIQPVPTYPKDNFTFSSTPVFKFTEDPSAIKYEITVTNYTTGVPVYTFRGGPNCASGSCSLVPTTELKPAIYSALKGYYRWVVRSKRATGWTSPSAPANFVVMKQTVNSTFDVLDSKWSSVNCDWTVTTKGYWKTNGELDEMCSSIEKHLFTSLVPSVGLVYEVRLKRKVEIGSPNILYFLGDPVPLVGDKWNKGYEWVVRYGGWSLDKSVDGYRYTIASDHFDDPYSDWIKLTVWCYGTQIHLWVNEDYLGSYTDSTYRYGYVGLGMVELDDGVSPLLVDSASVWYSPTPPY